MVTTIKLERYLMFFNWGVADVIAKNVFKNNFEIKDLGVADVILGIKILRNSNGLNLI